ncbi:MAG: T9SS type A sorting domain-containing protein [Saprospiraceae bacterium]|nr:T9SS type A sorting domain-containing protein [Saprospiraceae bacterium]MCF8248855.1 T9SS type A sorting domain-containing protein [Saprospiraceae bacterium]MCF8279580.1 T9SS type A sorting domain-containing protein [Bacteroidales bacterium]MCF8310140.1 T9SS type A sorting domain-containing protein [Saprospiraceae bacterium]MCF8439040.1 T9SS type A sorting domain-containing protein [Saprospiraceae bacterium]
MEKWRLAFKIFFVLLLVGIGWQAAFGQATLPVNRTNWNPASTPTGWTDSGTGYYNSSFACSGDDMGKLDTDGDYYRVYFGSAPGQLSYYLKATGSSTSTCFVEESSNGTTWSTIFNHTSLPTSCTQFTFNLNSTSRYVRWTYFKTSENLGLDDVNIAVAVSQNYYRSKQSGNWSDINTWESSPDNSTWSNATVTPTNTEATITIQSGHTVTITTGSSITFDETVIQNGATLQLNQGVTATLANGAGVDLDCSGTFLNSGTVTWNTGVTMNIQSSGTYVHNTGASSTSALNVTTFSPGCTWIYRGSTGATPSAAFNGRTYENLIIESSSGTYNLIMSGGLPLTINGDFTLGSGVTIINDMSNINVFAGNFTNNGTITNSTNTQIYTFTGTGKTIEGTTTTAFETLTVTPSASISLGNNISIASGFTGTVNGILNCSYYSIAGAGAFTLASGATIITANASGMSGTVTTTTKSFSSSANYEFQGASTGTFATTPNSLTVNNLIINNSGVVTSLGQNLTVGGSLSLTSGMFNLNDFVLVANTIANPPGWGSSTSNYIIAESTGTLQRTLTGGNNPVFPIGTSTLYMPCQLNGTGTFNINISITSPGLSNPSNALPNQWNITGSGTLGMDFQWPSFVFGSSAYLFKYFGSNWSSVGGPVTVGGSNPGPYTVSFSGISCCSGFTVGAESALPVELVSFYGKLEESKAVLTWQTTSELNNSHFAIEKSANGRPFYEIGTVQGQGTSYEINDYTFTDASPAHGLNYYRLKQVDFDGNFEYSKVVSVNFKDVKGQVQLYPTIASDEIHVSFSAPTSETGIVQVFDQSGNLVKQINLDSEIGGLPISVEEFQRGVYFVSVQNGQLFETLRFIKQ